MIKKIIMLFVTLSLLSFFPGFSVFAAPTAPSREDYNQQIKEQTSILEEKYQIQIRYPLREDGYSEIGTATLATLDSSLSYLSETFVHQLSLFYYQQNGTALTVEYTYLPKDMQKRDVSALGYFSSGESKIQLFLPTEGQNMTLTGNSPFVILHEFGHAYYVYLREKTSAKEIKEDWLPLNYPYKYAVYLENPNKDVFMSQYSSYSFEEDFAETFAYTFGCNRDGLGIGYRLAYPTGEPTNLGRKAAYISKSIHRHIQNPKDALANIEKSKSANPIKVYQNLRLSGNSLEYMQFNQPSGILANVLQSLKIKATNTEWYWQIGGWKVWDENGGIYFVFPGSTFVTLHIPKK